MRAAQCLADLASREGGPRSARLWARRSRALRKRIDATKT
jgi:hypothetical protein